MLEEDPALRGLQQVKAPLVDLEVRGTCAGVWGWGRGPGGWVEEGSSRCKLGLDMWCGAAVAVCWCWGWRCQHMLT